MGITNFPNGISSFGIPIVGGASGEEMITGNVFYVGSASGGSDSFNNPNQGKAPEHPFATIDFANDQCTADNGDVIFVMPGHAETIGASTTLDVAGVWVRGLGWGNDRPTISWSLTEAEVIVTADSVRISNLVFDLEGSTITPTIAVNVEEADGVIVENCEWKPHATRQFGRFLTVTDSDDVIVRNNRMIGLDTAAGVAGVVLDGCNQLQFCGNYVSGHFSINALDNTIPGASVEILRAYIVGNIVENKSSTASDLAFDVDADATGVLAYNFFGTGLDFEAGFDHGNLSMWENYMWDLVDTSGALIPTATSTS
jgi:hypothetical protein